MRQTNFQEFFSNFLYFSGKWCEEPLTNDADSPIPLYSHVNVFSWKKVSKYHCLQINYWYITICKMILLNMFTKKCHRSIMISIEVSPNHHKALYKNTKLQSTKYRKQQIRLPKIVPKNHPHKMGTRCPPYGQWVPITWSVDAHHMVPECPCDGHSGTSQCAYF